MQVHDAFAQLRHFLPLGFDDEEEFPVLTDVSFPSVDRGETRDDVDAGRESLLDQRACYRLRFRLTTDGDQDNAVVHVLPPVIQAVEASPECHFTARTIDLTLLCCPPGA